MRCIDVLEFRLFQEFVAVAHLHIGTAVLVIEIDGMVIYMAVSSEFVGQAVVAPVHITEKHYFGIIIKRYRKCVPEHFV